MCPGARLNAWKCCDQRLAGNIMRAGTLHGQSPGRQMILPFGSIAYRSIMSSVIRPETDSGMMVNAIPGSAKKCSASARNSCSPSSRNPVRLHPGTAFTFIPESRSPCPGIRTHRLFHHPPPFSFERIRRFRPGSGFAASCCFEPSLLNGPLGRLLKDDLS